MKVKVYKCVEMEECCEMCEECGEEIPVGAAVLMVPTEAPEYHRMGEIHDATMCNKCFQKLVALGHTTTPEFEFPDLEQAS